jgi:hypothetical protein
MAKKLDLDDLQGIICCMSRLHEIAEKVDPEREKLGLLKLDIINSQLHELFISETHKYPPSSCISKDRLKEYLEENAN